MKRKYLNENLINEVTKFAEFNKLKWESPHGRDNFPFYLEKYVEHLKKGV